MIHVVDWVGRLRDACGIDVHGAAELAQAQSKQTRDSLYVIPLDERAAPSDVIGPVRQMVTAGMAIVLAATNRRSGGAGVSEIEALRSKVHAALLGWRPPGAAGTVHYRDGQMLEVADSTLWWRSVFQVDYLILEATDE